jgi:uncharacterized protein (TIGR02271 family)
MKDHARRRPRNRGALDETRVQSVEHIERVEERIVPEVHAVQAGSVRVERRTVEVPESVAVDARHDVLHLERRSVDRPLAPGELPVTERGDSTVVLVIEERLEIRKVPWVVEEVHLRREVVTEPVTVTDTVRRQHIEIAPEGDVHLSTDDS